MSDPAEHPEILIETSVVSSLWQEAESMWPLETGGVLFGTVAAGLTKILHACGPGPNAKHGYASFSRDGEFAQQEMEKVVIQSNGEIDYLGEWHSHPLNVGPSSRDKKSICHISSNPSYGMTQPLLVLCLPRKIVRHRTWELRAYRLTGKKLIEQSIAET